MLLYTLVFIGVSVLVVFGGTETSALTATCCAIAVALALVFRRFNFSRCLFALSVFCAISIVLMEWRYAATMSSQLPAELEKAKLEAVGTIVELPERDGEFWRFQFNIEELSGEGLAPQFSGKVRLSWKTDRDIEIGQRWRFQLRLKRPRGFVNPEGFDYQAWLLSKKIVATGYVAGFKAEKLSETRGALKLRNAAAAYLNAASAELDNRGIVRALLLGDRSEMSNDDWSLFRSTGTIHLMAISGLHIGMVAVFSRLLIHLLLVPFARWLNPVFREALVLSGSTGLAFSYALLSGFSLPSRRAALCVLIVNLCLFFGRRPNYLLLLAYVACVLIIENPFVLTATGFVLSFAAVAALVYAFSNRVSLTAKGITLVKAQIVVALLLAPVMALFGLPSSVTGPIANFVAVPLMSLLIMPLLFLSTLSGVVNTDISLLLFSFADFLISQLMNILVWIDALDLGLVQFALSHWLWCAVAIVGALLMLSPAALRLRSYGVAVLIIVFFANLGRTHSSDFKITALDVGQGLALIIQQKDTAIVYDLGAKFSDSFSIARSVISPYLKRSPDLEISALIVSHSDADHVGDLDYFIAEHQLDERNVYLGERDKHPKLAAQSCRSDISLNYLEANDNLSIEFVYPRADSSSDRKANNRSCVLLMDYSGRTVLFTGDIERKVELELLNSGVLPANIDILVAGHHGSNTSSSALFIEHLKPKHVIYSAGYKNRYRHPSSRVVQRIHEQGGRQWNTAYHGALDFEFRDHGIVVTSHRCLGARRWLDTSNCGFGSFSDSNIGYD